MEQPNNPTSKNKWHGRLAVLFLLLFSIFWSLGAFFFWVLLGLASSFSVLALDLADIKIPVFNQSNDGRLARSVLAPSNIPDAQDRNLFFRKISRFLMMGGLAFLFIIFFIWTAARNNKKAPVETTNGEDSSGQKFDAAIAYTTTGTNFFNTTQYDSALKYYDRALAVNPDSQDAIYNKALVFYMKQDYRKSIGIVKKCLRLNADYNTAWWLLGDDYYSIDQYDSAIFCLEKAYAHNFNDPAFLQLMGNAYLKNNNPAKAKEFYLKVIEQDTTQADVYRQLVLLDPEKAEWYRAKVMALEQPSK